MGQLIATCPGFPQYRHRFCLSLHAFFALLNGPYFLFCPASRSIESGGGSSCVVVIGALDVVLGSHTCVTCDFSVDCLLNFVFLLWSARISLSSLTHNCANSLIS